MNGMDLQSDQAYEARRAQEWIEQSDRIQSRRLYEVTAANAQDNFGATERQYRLETETSVAGSGYVARSGDSISRILGSSSPQAIGNFMRANGLTSDRIEAGRNYFRPASVTTYGDSAALGQFALNQSNERIAAQRAAAALARNTSVTGDITLGDLDVLNAAFDRRDQAIASLRNFVGPLQPVTGFGEIKASPEIGLGKQLAGAVFGEPLAFVRKLAGDLPVNPITNRLENFDGADRTLLAAMGIAPLPFAKAAQGARVGEQLTTAALRSEAAASIREARNLLKDAGVPLLARNEIIRSFELESFRVQRLTSEQTALRVFDDSNATLVGRYVSPDFFGNQTDRITNFALMKNSATRLGEVTMPQGSVVFTGRVAPQLSYSPGLTGGANQIFLTGPLSNYQFREVMLPR
ncbi:MAG: LysM peptidoglycan-binding domain-containing protein [Acidovorax sp.]|nr:LysM peptidoglycan-binding domain-containing protein [Acidovorax sp.]